MLQPLLVLFFTLSGLFADIENFSVSGASRVVDNTGSVPAVVAKYNIYGGFAGDTSVCTPGQACNTCVGAFPKACNKNALLPGSILSFTFSSTENTNGGQLIITKDVSEENALNEQPPNVDPGQSATMTIPWSKICEEINGDQSCNTPGFANFRVGYDAAPINGKLGSADDYIIVRIEVLSDLQDLATTKDAPNADSSGAIYDYTMLPGDSRAFLTNTLTTNNFISRKPQAVVVYFTEAIGDCNSVFSTFNFDTPSVELPISVSGSNFSILNNASVGGLVNGSTYCFRLAIKDQAGNLHSFTPNEALDGIDDDKQISNPIATPDQVLGFLEEGNCFIATAAFGSPLDARLNILRGFRDEVLVKNPLGLLFVDLYYSYSKPLALLVAYNPLLQKIIQILLWPVLALSFLALNAYWLLLILPLFYFTRWAK